MEKKIPGKHESFWIDTTPETDFPELEEGLYVDVVIIGGGIAGVTTAALLKDAGKKVVVLEADRIVKDVTAATTAKISVSQGLVYQEYTSKFGESQAQNYAQANKNAVKIIKRLVDDYSIDCDFEVTPCYVYTTSEDLVEKLKLEAEAAQKIGIAAVYTDDIPLPFETVGGVLYRDQAQFNPRKYIIGLAEHVEGDGSHIFEKTRVLDVKNNAPNEVITEKGILKADQVVVASHFPVYDPDNIYSQLETARSYVMAFYPKQNFPEGMFIDMNPIHPYRTVSTDKGRLVIVGGEHHPVGRVEDTFKYYKDLEEYIRTHVEVRSIEYSWSSQDIYVSDGVPVVGQTSEDGIYIATGFRAWGITNGTNAAILIRDLILGIENPMKEFFNPLRFKNQETSKKIMRYEKHISREVRWPVCLEVSDFPVESGRIVETGTGNFAVYRDVNGELFVLQAGCTHKGCTLSWNNAEKSWDCPCNGSRFNFRGEVIHGPAVKGLERIKTEKSGGC